MRYLTVDGMMSGTGVRDTVRGGYLEHEELALSPVLSDTISRWLARYEAAYFRQFPDPNEVTGLDAEGVEICRLLRSEIPDSKVGYFSNAKMATLPV